MYLVRNFLEILKYLNHLTIVDFTFSGLPREDEHSKEWGEMGVKLIFLYGKIKQISLEAIYLQGV